MSITPYPVAKEAILVQDASNISGVARSLVSTIDAIRTANPGGDSDTLRRNPAVRLFIHKLVDLAGAYNQDDFSEAYRELKAIVATTN